MSRSTIDPEEYKPENLAKRLITDQEIADRDWWSGFWCCAFFVAIAIIVGIIVGIFWRYLVT